MALPTMVGSNLLEKETLCGWTLSAIVNIQTGMPYNIQMSSSTTAAGVDQGSERPSIRIQSTPNAV